MNTKTILAILLIICSVSKAFPWGSIGHKDIVAIAERHLTPQARQIAEDVFKHSLVEEACWMDQHRKGEWAFTNSWHVLYFDKDLNYDPDPTLAVNTGTRLTEEKGDALKAIQRAVYTLSDYKNLNDSTFMINVRYLLHFMGDMHCPVHNLIPGRTTKYTSQMDGREFYPVVGVLAPVKYDNVERKSFHTLYDAMPAILYPDKNPKEVAACLDTKTNKEIKRIIGQKALIKVNNRYDCTTALYRWAHECAEASMKMWEWNPEIEYNINPQTAELSREMIEQQLSNAGYRLAWLLNTLLQ